MSRPIVSEAAEQLYAELAPLATADEESGWQLLLFCEAVYGTLIEGTRTLLSETDEYPNWGLVMDVDRAPAAVLPWLAQFVGVRLTPDLTEAEQREAIRVHAGFQRGTPLAIQAAVARLLTGSKHITFEERSGGNAYRLLIRTYEDETPDPDRVRAAILSQKPAGIVLDYEAVTGVIYSVVESTYDDYADMLSTADDYAGVLQP